MRGGQGYRRIVVFKPGAIGDFLHSLPAVDALRGAFPEARITLVMASETADLALAHPAADERVFIPSDVFRGDPVGFFRFLMEVRGMRPDLFVDLKGNVKSFLIGCASGARKILRYRKQRKLGQGERRLHAAENLLRTVEPVTGAGADPRYRIIPLPEDERVAEAFIREALGEEGVGRRKVVLNPTVGWAIPSRLWPPDYYARLGDRIRDELGCAVILTGAPSDREYLENIASGMRFPPVIAAGRLSLGQTAALIRQCDLFVSGDTGPLHIAAAVGTPVIGLYGSVSVERSRPLGDNHVVMKKEMWCLPCEKKVCPLGTTQCMKDLTVEEVFRVVRENISREAREG